MQQQLEEHDSAKLLAAAPPCTRSESDQLAKSWLPLWLIMVIYVGTALLPHRPDPAETTVQGASLDHAVWFLRPVRATDWNLIDMTGHGMVGTRGLATGHVFSREGTHVATIAQEGLLRVRAKKTEG